MGGKLMTTIVLSILLSVSAVSQSTEFTYQGSLRDGINTANGSYDFEFRLFDVLAGGSQIGPLVTRTNVPVANGTFGVHLDFGGVFPGTDRYLDIRVRSAGAGGYTPLSPRTRVNSSPYGIKSLISETANNAGALGGIPPSGFIQNTITPQPASSFNVTEGAVSGNFSVLGTATLNVVNVGMNYRLGGARILHNAGTENLFVGVQSGFVNTTGAGNAFVGSQAGFSNASGNNNSFFGNRAGQSNTNGFENSFFGGLAGQLNTSGAANAFFGYHAGRFNTTGSNNSFFGGGVFGVGGTGYLNSTGNFNSFFGHRAGEFNNIGSLNSFFGTGSGFFNTSGNSNTFVGHDSGIANGSGSFNTMVGENSDVGLANLTNATAIGSKALVSQSNSIVLGSIDGTNGATAGTMVGIGTTAPDFKLHIVDSTNTGLRVQTNAVGGTVASFGGNGVFQIDSAGVPGGRMLVTEDGRLGLGNVGGTPTDRLEVYGFIRTLLGGAGSTALCYNLQSQISTCSSSLRYKKNVRAFVSGLDLISRLRPVSFAWRDGNVLDFGLVAEEVAKIEPLLTSKNSKGEIEGVKYDRLGVILVNAVKEQQVQIGELSTQIATEKTQNQRLREQIEELTKLVCVSNPQAQICKEKRQ